MNLFRPAVLALACLMPLASIASDLPALGDASSAIVSPEQEHALGRAWLNMLRSQVKQLNDPQLKDYVESSVYKLAETSQVEDRRLEFILINSIQLNAFAAPGGIVGVNGGLFLNATNESEYIAVLAHELAHLSQRHFARGVEAQQQMKWPLLAGLLAGVVIAAAGGGDAGIAAIAGTQAAAIQSQQHFSRENEAEADRIGMLNLEKAGYDPRAMPAMFELLMRQYRFDAKPPEFLLDHPVTESRIADTRNRAEQFKPGGKTDSPRYQLMRARVQLFYEESPGMAGKRFRALLEENPTLDAARYGLAISLVKVGQLNEARAALKPLLDKEPSNITYNLAAIELDITNNRAADAQTRAERMAALYPSNYPLNQVRADLLVKAGRPADALKILETLLKNRSDDPDVWYSVAETRGLAGNIIGLHQARAEYFVLMGEYDQALQQLDFAERKSSGNFQMASRIDARAKEIQEQKRVLKDMM